MPYRRMQRLATDTSARVLDVCLPLLYASEPAVVLQGAEEMRAQWHERRRAGGVPVINGRAGAALYRSDRGEQLAASFTARIPSDHPFYNDPQKLTDAVVDLLDLLGPKLNTRSDPCVIYNGEVWRSDFTWRQD